MPSCINAHIEYNRYREIQQIGPNLVKFASSSTIHLLKKTLKITNNCYLNSSCLSAIFESSDSYECCPDKKSLYIEIILVVASRPCVNV